MVDEDAWRPLVFGDDRVALTVWEGRQVIAVYLPDDPHKIYARLGGVRVPLTHAAPGVFFAPAHTGLWRIVLAESAEEPPEVFEFRLGNLARS